MTADGHEAAAAPAKGTSLWREAGRKLRRERVAMACATVVALYVLVGLLASAGTWVNSLHQEGRVGPGWKRFADAVLFADYAEPAPDSANRPPTWWPDASDEAPAQAPALPGDAAAPTGPPAEERFHLFGTDLLGRDVFSRVANGTGIALRLGLGVGALAVVIGFVFGAMAGWFGRVVDEGVTWLYSTISSIPDIMLMVAIAYMWPWGRGFGSMLVAMACTYWVGVARIVRAEFLKLRERDYVLAARAQGLSNARIMLVHVAPNVAHLLIVLFTLLFVEAVKAEVILSYLGVGIINEPSWGLLISDAETELMRGLWWQITFTSLALFGIVLALQVFGDALRDALDPRLRH